jgi:hypothetical protein
MLPLFIALVVMGLAIFLQKMGQKIFETETSFKLSVVVFFIVYIASAVALHYIGPNLDQPSDVSSMISLLNQTTSLNNQ